MLALATERDWGIRQFDFSTAYLNAPLTETVYAYPPVGNSHPDNPDLIWLLLISLYGAKQRKRKKVLAIGISTLKTCLDN